MNNGTIIVDVSLSIRSELQVIRATPEVAVLEVNNRYNVIVNGDVKHSNCSAEDTIRALGNYLHLVSKILRTAQTK